MVTKKWMVRADCWPPRVVTAAGIAEAMPGDMAVLVGKHVVIAGGYGGAGGGKRQFEERRRECVAGFAPIEARMREENFAARHEQGQQGEGGDPMGGADNGMMPGTHGSGGRGHRSVGGVGHLRNCIRVGRRHRNVSRRTALMGCSQRGMGR
jgi:hypothetical protein